ncbi:Ycf20-like protein [Linum perenne]
MGTIMLQRTQPGLLIPEKNQMLQSPCALNNRLILTTTTAIKFPPFPRVPIYAYSVLFFDQLNCRIQITRLPRHRRCWRISLALNAGGGLPGNGQQNLNDGDDSGLGGTRLGRIVSAGGRQLLEKLNSARKNFPTKVFLLLLGFYTANALATILGQTGDWDVLVAGIVVAAIEGIGMLMYRDKKPSSKPPTSSSSQGRFKNFVLMVNYWKAGVCLGLFVDAFKLGS